jgi:SpoIVB peptidase S55
MALADVHAGQKGTVWTVFQGTRPEPFSVEVTGVIQNALGPGHSLILCRLDDPKVSKMGAVAGMSGSPLYIDGHFVGALSYQLQIFETDHYAGFTPAEDLDQVAQRVPEAPSEAAAGPAGFVALRPVLALGGVSPQTASLLAPTFRDLGLDTVALGGNATSGPSADPLGEAAAQTRLDPGDAVAVALATGDISLAGTGTVSRVDGRRITAFGHPMLGSGNVQFAMCKADVVAILPSQYRSFKVANVGAVIGTITQDRLSAVSGTLGPGPDMTDVEVQAEGRHPRTLHFEVVKDHRIAPAIMMAGVSEAILQSNDAEASEGFRIRTSLTFPGDRSLVRESIYAGPNSFFAGLFEFLIQFSGEVHNPFEEAIPTRVVFNVVPLERNPQTTAEQLQVSRAEARAGDTVQATLTWRDYQGAIASSTVDIPIPATLAGKTLEIVALPGRILDELSGHGHFYRPGQLRSFDAYLNSLRDTRQSDGLYLALVERTPLFFDQEVPSSDLPASVQRIEASADPTRFQRRDAFTVHWQSHLLDGKVVQSDLHRALRVVE